jgi:preprotein translocase subunit SecG
LTVFIPLDMLFSGKALANMTFVLVVVVCLVCLILGVTLERLRP